MRFGDNCLFGLGVYIYIVIYLIDLNEWNLGKEYVKLIIFGDNVWVGGSLVINLGVMIGNNVVIVSGLVVIKDVFNNVVVGGNLVKIIKRIEN